jgi:hypothetical protein
MRLRLPVTVLLATGIMLTPYGVTNVGFTAVAKPDSTDAASNLS